MVSLLRAWRERRLKSKQIDRLKRELELVTLAFNLEEDVKAQIIFDTLKKIRDLEVQVEAKR